MKRTAMGRIGLVALLTSVWLACGSSARSYDFQTLNNPGDPNFNALLSINDLGVIAGVYGDGKIVPGHGYTLVPPSAYTAEDFPRATNTNVAGINNIGTTTGFAKNPATGAYFGFYKQGNAYTPVMDPLTPAGGGNKLIGVNDANVAVGFYFGAAGFPLYGYTYDIGAAAFTPVVLPASFNAAGVVPTGINNASDMTGLYFDAAFNQFSFLEVGGKFYTISDPNGTQTSAYGLNNVGDVVGSFVDKSNETQGFVYDWLTNTWQTISDPLASANPPSCCSDLNGTTVYGINDRGSLVGLYSDGVNANGFLATVPEPSTWAMMLVGFGGLAFAGYRGSRRGGAFAADGSL
jgi:hypothetical protein